MALGAGRVAGAVGPSASRRKIEALHALGVAEVLGYHELDELAPVDVALDSVGGDVQARALDTLAPFGQLRAPVDRVLPLDAAGRAHRLIEDRCNVGKLVLLPRPQPAPPATGPSDG